MKSLPSRLGLVCCAAILGCSSGSIAQEVAAHQQTDLALRYFLNADCRTGDEPSPLNQLVAARNSQPGVAAQSLFDQQLILILRDGPGETSLKKVRASAEDAWERRSAFLKKNPKLGLSVKHYDMAVKRSQDKKEKELYVNRRLADFISRYRERSAIALGVIHTSEAIKALHMLSGTDDRALRAVIKTALESKSGH